MTNLQLIKEEQTAIYNYRLYFDKMLNRYFEVAVGETIFEYDFKDVEMDIASVINHIRYMYFNMTYHSLYVKKPRNYDYYPAYCDGTWCPSYEGKKVGMPLIFFSFRHKEGDPEDIVEQFDSQVKYQLEIENVEE